MKISVQFLSYLRDCLPPGAECGRITLELPEGIELSRLFSHIDFQRCRDERMDVEKFFSAWELSLNGEFVPDLERELHDGDQVIVLPHIAGG